MSKVELSIQEYDALKNELALYAEIVEAFVTPSTDVWSIDYYKSGSTNSLPLTAYPAESLSKKHKEIIQQMIEKSVITFCKEKGIDFDSLDINDNLHVSIGYVVRKEEEE